MRRSENTTEPAAELRRLAPRAALPAGHLIEFRAGIGVAQYGNAPRTGSDLFDGIENTGIVRPVDSCLHDDNAIDVQGPVQRAQLRYGGGFGRVNAGRCKRKSPAVSDDMYVAVARMRGHVKIHRSLWLRGTAKSIRDGPGDCRDCGDSRRCQNLPS